MIDEINKLYIEVQQGLIDGKVIDIGYLCSKTELSSDALELLSMACNLYPYKSYNTFQDHRKCITYTIGTLEQLNAIIKQTKSLAKKVIKASISYSYELGQKLDILIQTTKGDLIFKKMYVYQIERKEILIIGKEPKTQIQVTVGYKCPCGYTDLYALKFHKPVIHK